MSKQKNNVERSLLREEATGWRGLMSAIANLQAKAGQSAIDLSDIEIDVAVELTVEGDTFRARFTSNL